MCAITSSTTCVLNSLSMAELDAVSSVPWTPCLRGDAVSNRQRGSGGYHLPGVPRFPAGGGGPGRPRGRRRGETTYECVTKTLKDETKWARATVLSACHFLYVSTSSTKTIQSSSSPLRWTLFCLVSPRVIL